jgi:Leucine-rich repeat (LRR) protein
MEELTKIYNTNRQITEISLSNKKINDLAELLPLLSQFRDLENLDLSNN